MEAGKYDKAMSTQRSKSLYQRAHRGGGGGEPLPGYLCGLPCDSNSVPCGRLHVRNLEIHAKRNVVQGINISLRRVSAAAITAKTAAWPGGLPVEPACICYAGHKRTFRSRSRKTNRAPGRSPPPQETPGSEKCGRLEAFSTVEVASRELLNI